MRTSKLSLAAMSIAGAALLAASLAGCPITSSGRNPFLAYTEEFGSQLLGRDPNQSTGGGSGTTADQVFRRNLTLTMTNNDTVGALRTQFVAWVEVSSIRNTDQTDALLRANYVQIDQEQTIGSVFRLPPGTWVYNGPGALGATPVNLAPAAVAAGEGQDGALTPTTQAFTLLTPDVLLVFKEPPVSCESVAFEFVTETGEPVRGILSSDVFGIFGGATSNGGSKTLSQVSAYQCSPLRPGLFFRAGGGARQANEFFEGQAIQIGFTRVVGADNIAAQVTIGG